MEIAKIRIHSGYTLLEVLLALGVIAILLGISVPYLGESFRQTPGEEASATLEKTVLAARSAAMEKGEARRLNVNRDGINSELDSIPTASLPSGWKLEIRRMTESKFRAPNRHEIWEFNGAGICEPISLRLSGESESIILSFDPLTGLVVPDE